MLRRYTIYRGARPPGDALPDGVRQDARFRCKKHPLHPPEALVKAYFAAPGEAAWQEFRRAYVAELERRFQEDRTPFDRLAALATEQDLYIGCSCPTKRNPRVDRCHTWLALEFMQGKYPGLRVEFPAAGIGRRENIGPLPGTLPRG
ncbi:MAG: hypothetical protein HRF50_08010 [Phycisphaerae bacterium]